MNAFLCLSVVLLVKIPCGILQANEDNKELQALVNADQAARQGDLKKVDWKNIEKDDAGRRKRVSELLASGLVATPNDLSNAALVYQHGDKANDYLTANELSVLAGTKGQLGSMCALSQDRFLVNIGRKQRFGSQFSYKPDGSLSIENVDEGGIAPVTDDLRMDFLVPPLQLAREKGVAAGNEAFPEIQKRIETESQESWQTEHNRSGTSFELKELAKSAHPDSQARHRTLTIYEAGQIKTKEDFRCAAQVLATSKDSEVLLLANEFAMAAAIHKDPTVLTLFALTWDEFLVSVGRSPRFGRLQGHAALDPSVTRPMREALKLD